MHCLTVTVILTVLGLVVVLNIQEMVTRVEALPWYMTGELFKPAEDKIGELFKPAEDTNLLKVCQRGEWFQKFGEALFLSRFKTHSLVRKLEKL